MSRVVLVIDSATGALVDVAGNSREAGRYAKFAKRMLSRSTNPRLDYSVNGGDSLEISKNGNAGAKISLLADEVDVSGLLKAGGKTMEEIATAQILPALGYITGEEGEIDVRPVSGQDPEGPKLKISLDPAVAAQLEQMAAVAKNIQGMVGNTVKKDELLEAMEGMELPEDATLEETVAKFNMLITRLAALAEGPSSSGEEE